MFRARTWLIGILTASASIPSCNSHLRRDDVAGRPCPCLPGWDKSEGADGSCVCVVRVGNTSTANATSGGSSLGSNSTSLGGTGAKSDTSTLIEATGGTVTDTQSAGGTALGGASSGNTANGGGGSPSSVNTANGGGGSSSSVNTANGGGGSSSFANAGNGNNCPAELVPPASSVCTTDCTGCSQGECWSYCNQAKSCEGQIVNCAPGLGCHVICSGTDSCNDLVVNCPEHYACRVECTGRGACQNVRVTCSEDGPCVLDCESGTCREANIDCGRNACRHTCNPQITALGCADSCIPDCGCP